MTALMIAALGLRCLQSVVFWATYDTLKDIITWRDEEIKRLEQQLRATEIGRDAP